MESRHRSVACVGEDGNRARKCSSSAIRRRTEARQREGLLSYCRRRVTDVTSGFFGRTPSPGSLAPRASSRALRVRPTVIRPRIAGPAAGRTCKTCTKSTAAWWSARASRLRDDSGVDGSGVVALLRAARKSSDVAAAKLHVMAIGGRKLHVRRGKKARRGGWRKEKTMPGRTRSVISAPRRCRCDAAGKRAGSQLEARQTSTQLLLPARPQTGCAQSGIVT